MRTALVSACVAAVLATAACSSSGPAGSDGSADSPSTPTGSSPSSQTSSGGSAPAAGGAKAPSSGYYVSIGDSYAAGYQPANGGRTTRDGFAYKLVDDAKPSGYALQLANFGCAGATTTSVLKTPGCKADLLGPDATAYTQPQASAAEQFLRAHKGKVALVTIVLGGNDFTVCTTAANPVACLNPAIARIKQNLTTLVKDVRAAAGASVPIIGLTYPDVLLGNYLSKNAKVKNLARLSILAFQGLINPALSAAYQSGGARFVDITAATGAYGPITAMTTLAPYGRVPVPVAKICTLTWYCEDQDIHPRAIGYEAISKAIVAQLPRR